MKRSSRGLSLIEILICCALTSLFLLCVLYLFQVGIRYVKRAEGMLDLQQSTVNAMAWFNREASESNVDVFKDYVASDQGCVFASPRDMSSRVSFDGVGRLLWQSYIAYYIENNADGVPCLMRKQIPISPPMFELPAVPTLASMKAAPGGARVLGRNIDRLEGDTEPLPPQLLTLHASIRPLGKTYALKVTTSVYFRN